MYTGKIIFSQIMDFLPMYEFRKCVNRYQGNYYIKTFTCLDQFLCMSFAQLTYRESLRDIEACLRSMQNKLYHMGIRGKVSRSTLSDANERRDWRIYADFAQVLIYIARALYINDEFGVELENTVYALDSTTIDLCLSLFPWARFRKRKGAIKLHTLLDLRGNIPSFIEITDGKVHDVNILDDLIPEPGSFYIMDRGYIDFLRLHVLTECSAFVVTRAKSNFKCCWQVELFFKWIKQNLRIKSFYSTSFNAVKTQVWKAVSVYVLITIIKNALVYSLISTLFCRFSVLLSLSNCLLYKYLQILI